MMTKKQVLFSLRQRIDYHRSVAQRNQNNNADCNLGSYFSGCVDSFDLVLEFLCDYD